MATITALCIQGSERKVGLQFIKTQATVYLAYIQVHTWCLVSVRALLCQAFGHVSATSNTHHLTKN